MRIMLAPLLAPLVAAGLTGCATPSPPPQPPVSVAVVAPPPPSTPPTIAPICGRAAEKGAFATAALKTQLVVTAISCSQQDRYNAVILRFRPNLVAQEKVLGGFFSRAYGRQAVSQQDDYSTTQINQTSQVGLRKGTAFCSSAVPMFDEVMALKNGDELVRYALAQNFEQTLTVPDCDAPATTPAMIKK
jgi:hypothetical protein